MGAARPGAPPPNHPLLPRHLKLHELFPGEDWKALDAVTGRRLVLGNADVRISYVVAGEASPLYRNAIGDECVYVESGTATVETVFGALAARAGDYVLLPRATTHRWVPEGEDPLRLYAIEANSHIAPPKRYLSRFGQFLEHSPYCERDLARPRGTAARGRGGERRRGATSSTAAPGGIAGTRYVLPTHPFDVVGWDGCLYPYTFNVADFEPITGRVHQPPPVHQVFEGQNFVICNFVPRKVDYHPLADPGAVLPLQRGLRRGDVLLRRQLRGAQGLRASARVRSRCTPAATPTGRSPARSSAALGAEFFDELAVMVDTFRPLEIGEGGRASDDPGYAWTWSGRGPTP